MLICKITGMEKLPVNCAFCDLCYDNDYCVALDFPEARNLNFHGERRPKKCPLCEIVEPIIFTIDTLNKDDFVRAWNEAAKEARFYVVQDQKDGEK